MATYKVLQDIEAEDKFLGPLTLKQFIFGAIAAINLYLSFFAITKNAAWMLAIFLPPAFLGAFLAIPWSKDQPTEVWVLAKMRFYIKPKRRIWNQSGVKELVTITVPKIIEHQLTNNLSQNEVTSRLRALAETIDSRGWAIKNSSLTAAAVDMGFSGMGDRLITPSMMTKSVPDFDVNQVHDVMDTGANSIAANFDQMIQSSSVIRRDESLAKMERIRRGESLESVQQPEVPFVPPQHHTPVISLPTSAAGDSLPPAFAAPDATEQQLSAQLRAQSQVGNEAYGRLRTVPVSGPVAPPTIAAKPSSAETGTHEVITGPAQTSSTMTTSQSPVILDLAQNDDLSVETIARQAKKSQQLSDRNEVIISLR